MKLSNMMRAALVGVLALGLVALAGCAMQGGTNDSAAPKADNAAEGNGQQATDEVVSTAMVAYANGDELLFVDQDTQTPYIPTDIDNATIVYNGQEIDEDDLVAGNIVKVTGNGIMLESYPGQYPGITKVEVIEQGSPADAEQYADIVDTVFASPDQSEVPVGNLSYKTTDANVSVMLNAFDYDWEWTQPDGTPGTAEQDGNAFAADGTVAEGTPDVRISVATDAVVAFSVNPTSVEIERRPLVKGDTAKVDPAAEDADVACTLGADGAAAFTMEPNYLYEVKATFPQGDLECSFYTVS